MNIVLAGDSTVAACPSQEYPMSGWGAQLAPLVGRWAAVYNVARGGATTESFRRDGLWEQALEVAGPGDWVLLQFGHNDQKQQRLAAAEGYTHNLRTMVAEVRRQGAIAVLCTSVERRNFHAGRQQPTLGDYAAAVRSLAAELAAPLLDLHAFTGALYAAAGEHGSAAYFTHLAPGEQAYWPAGLRDNTHFNTVGAATVAAEVARQLTALRGELATPAAVTRAGRR